jgi:hypothetical protein
MAAILTNTGVRANVVSVTTRYGLGVPGFERRYGRGVAFTTNPF